jgi:hypothetical protein
LNIEHTMKASGKPAEMFKNTWSNFVFWVIIIDIFFCPSLYTEQWHPFLTFSILNLKTVIKQCSVIIDQIVGIAQEAMGWQGPPQPQITSSYIVKKILRLQVPTDTYPNVCFYLSCFMKSYWYSSMAHYLYILLFPFWLV